MKAERNDTMIKRRLSCLLSAVLIVSSLFTNTVFAEETDPDTINLNPDIEIFEKMPDELPDEEFTEIDMDEIEIKDNIIISANSPTSNNKSSDSDTDSGVVPPIIPDEFTYPIGSENFYLNFFENMTQYRAYRFSCSGTEQENCIYCGASDWNYISRFAEWDAAGHRIPCGDYPTYERECNNCHMIDYGKYQLSHTVSLNFVINNQGSQDDSERTKPSRGFYNGQSALVFEYNGAFTDRITFNVNCLDDFDLSQVPQPKWIIAINGKYYWHNLKNNYLNYDIIGWTSDDSVTGSIDDKMKRRKIFSYPSSSETTADGHYVHDYDEILMTSDDKFKVMNTREHHLNYEAMNLYPALKHPEENRLKNPAIIVYDFCLDKTSSNPRLNRHLYATRYHREDDYFIEYSNVLVNGNLYLGQDPTTVLRDSIKEDNECGSNYYWYGLHPEDFTVTGWEIVSENDIYRSKSPNRSFIKEPVEIPYSEMYTNCELIDKDNHGNYMFKADPDRDNNIILVRAIIECSSDDPLRDVPGYGHTNPAPVPEGNLEKPLAVKQKYQLTAADFGLDTLDDVTMFTISDTKLAAVNKNTGLITAKKPGTVVVNAVGKYNPQTQGCIYGKAYITIEKPQITKTLTASYYGQTISQNGYLLDGSSPTRYESNKPNIASVSDNGLITVKASGTAKITLYYGEGKNAAKYSFTIKAKLPEINPKRVTVQSGKTKQLKLKNAVLSDATWSTENASIATVSESGLLSGTAPGSTRVIATVNGIKYYANVTVK